MSDRRSFAFQKAVFYNVKGHLSQAKRRPFANALTVSHMHVWARQGAVRYVMWKETVLAGF